MRDITTIEAEVSKDLDKVNEVYKRSLATPRAVYDDFAANVPLTILIFSLLFL